MIHDITRGQIVKGSCADIMMKNFLGYGVQYSAIEDLTLSFYTTDPSECMVKPLSALTMSGSCVVAHFEAVELESMEDGVLEYTAEYVISGATYTKEMDSPFYLKTPINHTAIDYATMAMVNSAITEATENMVVTEDLEPYAKKTEIPSLDGYAKEQWVLDKHYLTEHQDLSAYALKSEVPSLEGYATEQWVEDKHYLTEHQDLTDYAKKEDVPSDEHIEAIIDAETSDFIDTTELEEALEPYAKTEDVPSLSGYATEEWVLSKKYLTEHQSLDGYATEEWVLSKNYLTEHQDLTDYALKSWVEAKHYLTEHQSLSGYATEEWVKNQGYLTQHQDLTDYATKSWVGSQGYLTQHQDLSDYAKKTDIPTKVSAFSNDAGYLTEHQSLGDYYTKSQVNTMLDNIQDLQVVIVSELPETGRTNVMYFVPKTPTASVDGYAEYMYLSSGVGWEKIGETTANLQGYATQEWVLSKGYLTEHQPLKTINGQSISGTGNIVIEAGSGGTTYSAGSNIMISTDHVISVTGITSYTGITGSEVTSALGYEPAKKSDIPSLSGYATISYVDTQIGNINNVLESL